MHRHDHAIASEMTPAVGPVATATEQITCLIPTFNRRRLLTRAVASALLQHVPNMVVHVFDNHSTDGSDHLFTLLKARYSNFKATVHSENIGAYRNFCAAFASVSTPYFSILSDDDLLLPGFYRNALAYLNTHPDCGMYCADTLHATGSGSVRFSSNYNWKAGGFARGDGYRKIKQLGHPTWTGIVFRREVFAQTELLDNAGSPTDLDFELQTARKFGIYVSRYPGAVLTMSPITASANKPLSWVYPCWEDFMQRHCQGFGKRNTREIRFLSDRYFADLLSVFTQRATPQTDRCKILNIFQKYRFWSGAGNRLVRISLVLGGASCDSRQLKLALVIRKALKLIEQPRLLLNFLKLRRIDRVLRRLRIFTW